MSDENILTSKPEKERAFKFDVLFYLMLGFIFSAFALIGEGQDELTARLGLLVMGIGFMVGAGFSGHSAEISWLKKDNKRLQAMIEQLTQQQP